MEHDSATDRSMRPGTRLSPSAGVIATLLKKVWPEPLTHEVTLFYVCSELDGRCKE